jgi:hypothetical protein
MKQVESQKHKRRQHFNDVWIRYFHLFHLLRDIAGKYNKVKKKEILKLRASYCIRKIFRQYTKHSFQKGDTLPVRLINTIKMGLNFVEISAVDSWKIRSKQIIWNFLEKSSALHLLKSRMLKCQKHLGSIVNNLINKVDCHNQRTAWMQERWKREVSLMLGYLIDKKDKNKRLRALWKKLALILDDIRDRIIHLYLEMCYEKHRYRYFIWRREIVEGKGRLG